MRAEAGAEEQFGPYLVYERLGVGGMATVHRALERGIEGFERVVALKRLLPHLAADASFIKSFVREAKLASLLSHVNIVQIFECGRVGAQYFITMEYIDGRDIRRILRHARKASGPPPIHITVGVLLQLCDALDYAHGRQDENGHPLGLVHRDVSPSNVLVTNTGQVKVIDFGIAKAQSAQLRTQTGRVKGKLAYMAPEALVGKELDARSDLFAAGIICHELLTARPLFATKNDYQTLSKIQRGDILPPSTYNQSCPPELDAIVLRALARDPDERFLHAGELRHELCAMRKHYNLQTSARDIATWLEWAFGLESPTDPHRASLPRASSETELDVQPLPAERPSRPKRSDEEEAIEIAWGAGDDHGNGEPVVLDDVPDVTDKHLEMESSLGAEVRLDLDDLADDIPTPIPTGRGTSDASQRAVAAALLARPAARVKRPTPAMPLRNPPAPTPAPPAAAAPAPRAAADGPSRANPTGPAPRAIAADEPSRANAAEHAARAVAAAPAHRSADGRGMQPAIAAPSADGSARGPAMPPRSRTVTIPPRILPSSTGASTHSPGAPPPGAAPSPIAAHAAPSPIAAHAASAAMARGRSPSPTPPRAVPSGSIAPLSTRGDIADDDGGPSTPTGELGRSRRGRLAVGSSPRDAVPPRVAGTAPPPTVDPARSRARSDTAPGTGLGRRDTARERPDTQTTGPTTLFAADSLALGDAPITDRTPAYSLDELGLASDTIVSIPAMDMATLEPVVRFREPSRPPPLSAAAAPSRLVTPATALFAEPDTNSEAAAMPAPAALPTELDGVVPHRTGPQLDPTREHSPRRPIWRMAAVLIALALVGAAVTAGALQLWRGRRAQVEVAPPAPLSPRKTSGTIEFTVTPAAAAITVEGKPVHVGTPWSVDLPPGVYQLEVHHDGYMGWLTSVEVSAGEVHPLQIALEPLGATTTDATIVIGPIPSLDVVIDGTPDGRTPLKRAVSPGQHTIVLRRAGAEVWRKTLNAEANAVYELRPAIASPVGPAGAASAPSDPSSPPGSPADSTTPPPSGAATTRATTPP